MTRRRKIGLCIVSIVLIPVVFVAVLIGMLYLPPVQQWAVGKVCVYASEQTGMEIRLERIRIRFPLDIDLQNLSATTPPDTILAVQHVIVDLNLSDIFQGRIGVDALDIEEGTVDTRDLIATVIVKGDIGCLHVNAHPILLKEQRATLTGIQLDGCDVDIAMRDTTVIDTTETAPILWSIDLGNIEARKTNVAFHTVGDSICVHGCVKQLTVKGGDINLGEGIYKVDYALLNADSVAYNDMVLHGIGLEAQHLLIDDTHIQAPSLHLGTPYSHIDGRVNLEWTALTPEERGKMDIDIDASLGQTDLLVFANGFLSPEQTAIIPETPITLTAKAHGNVDSVNIDLCELKVSPMAEAVLQGSLTDVLDTEHLGADLQLEAKTYDLTTVRRLMGLDNSIHLPQMHLTGDAHLHDQQYAADLQLQQGSGRAWVKGQYNASSEAYKAKLDIRNLNLHNFLPKDSLFHLTAKADISGVGTDVLSRRASASMHNKSCLF